MSYDIDLKVKVDGTDRYVSVGNCHANVTWNVREIIEKSTGLSWKNDANNGFCTEIIPKISEGYWNLTHHPEAYKKYEPSGGYGSVEGTKIFFKEILDSWKIFAKYTDEQIVEATTFWIE